MSDSDQNGANHLLKVILASNNVCRLQCAAKNVVIESFNNADHSVMKQAE